MARTESVATAGYFATPPHLIARIASVLSVDLTPRKHAHGYAITPEASICDPCAGDGAAMLALGEALVPSQDTRRKLDYYACELEASRAEALKKAVQYPTRTLHGDAFRVSFKLSRGIGCLFLNPPYDTDREYKRLEHRFLTRFTSLLAPGGVLVYIVPYYALEPSAEFLAEHYDVMQCYRFPRADFEDFKQVVLYARRRSYENKDGEAQLSFGLGPEPRRAAQVERWASSRAACGELPRETDEVQRFVIPTREHGDALSEWRMRELDVTSLLARHKPWHVSNKSSLVPVAGVLPSVPLDTLLRRTYPVATPPRPAHIAAGMASGIFNGARIEPEKSGKPGGAKLPPLLIKGVFDREWRAVEEKRNKDGEITGEVQVQQPKLVTTVLDLKQKTFHVLPTGTTPTGAVTVDGMNVADLLKHYGASMAEVMAEQCPALYDPRSDDAKLPLHPSPRTLFRAQAHATRALVKLLRRQPDGHRAAWLLGEIGSGKSTLALVTARTLGAKRILVFCPPHLLDGWRDQVLAVAPDLPVHVLKTIADLDALPEAGGFVAVLSREAAKLGHGWEGIPTCPRCGHRWLDTPEALAKKRVRCTHQEATPATEATRVAMDLADALVPYTAAMHPALVPGAMAARRVGLAAGKNRRYRLPRREIVEHVFEVSRELTPMTQLWALAAFGTDEDIVAECKRILGAKDHDGKPKRHYDVPPLVKDLLLLLPPDHVAHEALATKYPINGYYGGAADLWGSHREDVKRLVDKDGTRSNVDYHTTFKHTKKGVTLDGIERLSLRAAEHALSCFSDVARFTRSEECGEFLFQAVPEPRRVSLARHILRYHRDAFDFLVIDEAHEAANDGSAQERAGHRLTTLPVPKILMTGSVMNGYAESFFANMWAISPAFRAEFARDDRPRFVDRFGYRKRLVTDGKEATVTGFGAQSDRVERSEKNIGDAPGVLPLFLLQHLLPISVTLHKADLALDLPGCSIERHFVEPLPEQKKAYETLKAKLIENIRADMFSDEGLSGKLFGQLAELPSMLDRCTSDVGNEDDGDYVIRYPESVGGEEVARARGISAETLLPKEEWMLRRVEDARSRNRRTMVLTWHVALFPRITRLLRDAGFVVAVLDADKVPTAKRQAWIDREVVKRQVDVLVCNPGAIQTGLNNLVYFSTQVWHENPAYNAIVFRQAMGRLDRIGQSLPVEVHFPLYKDTLQSNLYDLLMHKVAVSVSADGLDPEAALMAAGLGDDAMLAGLSVGKQLWAAIGGMGGGDEPRGKRRGLAARAARKEVAE